MTPNPILKVLSTFKKHNVKCLLIGGQACIIYGAAEFSRDSDFVILSDPDNLSRLRNALRTLKARLIYVPPLDIRYLRRGHACHFRCAREDVKGLRVDLISVLRGCDDFALLWKRRRSVRLKSGTTIDVIGLEDLVRSKKTQRDKDWLMLKRLVENDMTLHRDNPPKAKVRWWLRECRDAGRLTDLAKKYPGLVKECAKDRPLLLSAVASDTQRLIIGLRNEELKERLKDVEYWTPLKKELEALRHRRAARR